MITLLNKEYFIINIYCTSTIFVPRRLWGEHNFVMCLCDQLISYHVSFIYYLHKHNWLMNDDGWYSCECGFNGDKGEGEIEKRVS